MRVPRLHVGQPLIDNSLLTIDGKRAHYMTHVLRMTEGRELILFNGTGVDFSGKITGVQKKSIDIRIDGQTNVDTESALHTTLAVGISKGDRMDWVIQKATELGVSVIQPLFTEHGDVKLKGDRLHKKVEHWLQVAISACEQSGRSVLPSLLPPLRFNDFVALENAGLKLMCHFESTTQLTNLPQPSSVTVLIGPEGGLSDNETTLAQRYDFIPLTLGPRILRTETAPLAMLTLAQHLWGDI